jgi:hypothetical protein
MTFAVTAPGLYAIKATALSCRDPRDLKCAPFRRDPAHRTAAHHYTVGSQPRSVRPRGGGQVLLVAVIPGDRTE